MRITKNEVRGLVDQQEAIAAGYWFVADRYLLLKGCVYPEGCATKLTRPLLDPELFLSFARLGAHGNPGEERMLSWVGKYGLLERRSYADFRYLGDADGSIANMFESSESAGRGARDVGGHGTINQKPMTVGAFGSEVRQAYKALKLFEDIREKNYGALRERIREELIEERDKHGDAWDDSAAYLADYPIPFGQALEGDYPDDVALGLANTALDLLVERQLSDVRLAFTIDFRHPRPLSTLIDAPYRSRLSWRCPDLRSALWYQFAKLVGDMRPLRNCEMCEKLFPLTRSDRLVCGPTCRKRRERELKKRARATRRDRMSALLGGLFAPFCTPTHANDGEQRRQADRTNVLFCSGF